MKTSSAVDEAASLGKNGWISCRKDRMMERSTRHDLRWITMKQFPTTFLILTLTTLVAQKAVAEPKRVALVIGNSDYESAPLKNPVHDADAVSLALKGLGFTVTVTKNVTKSQIENAVDAVTDILQKGDMCLIFYAGHGQGFENDNYLIPIGANLDKPQHVKQRCVSTSYLLSALRYSECSLKVVVVDACRNNPFRSFGRSQEGLNRQDAPEGTIVSFSTSPKTGALDGDGDNSPYVTQLVGAMRARADKVEIVRLFREVSQAVKRETGQRPHLDFDASMPDYFLKRRRDLAPDVPEMKVKPSAPASRDQITNSIGMKLRLIPAGEFMMGSPASEEGRSDDEGPQHRVQITKPFYAGRHEVTVGQVLQWLNSGVSFDETWIALASEYCPVRRQGNEFVRNSSTEFGRSDDQPMVEISWHGAVAFCDWCSGQDSRHRYRLPTEAEWEYLARAGRITPFPWGSSLNGDQANIDGNYPYGTSTKGQYHEVTVNVGSYPANDWDLFDTAGNVYEWCSDWYDSDFYADSPEADPSGPSTGSSRVLRGGSWFNYAINARSAFRFHSTPVLRYYGLGFRVVCD